MSSTPLAEAEEDVFDLTEVVPETERLDSSLQKAKAQLSIKTKRHRPSRTRLRDSVSSIDGDESTDRMSYGGSVQTSSSPLHPSFRCSSPSSDLLLSSPSSRRDQSFTFDPYTVVGEREVQDERRSYRHLLNTSSQETLHLTRSKSPCRPCVHSETSSPAHRCETDNLKSREGSQPLLHYGEYSQSEDDSHDTGPDEPESPTVLLDKKTRRRFLDLGNYGMIQHYSTHYSFFKGSSTDEDFDSSVGLLEDARPCKTESSQPYQTLPEHSDGNDYDNSRGTDFSFKKKMLSAAGKDRTERQNTVNGKRDGGKNGHSEDGQKLLTT
ncbi:hypothetical protein PO909_013093 [Leuciscus waleckii]